MKSVNSALIQDEVLGEVLSVFNKEKSAGPRFLNCLTSIVEACVLHEFVFVLPSDDARAGEVRPFHSSDEADEQDRATGGGVSGAKGKGRGKHGRATHAPDTEPGKRVPGA